MMDRIAELETFLAIVDAGSLAAAGRRLNRSPPAVTRILSALEERIGARLIERTTRSLGVSEAGRVLADQARRIVSDYRDATATPPFQRQLAGLLRVTAPLVFGRVHVAPIVRAFLEDHPGVRVDLILSDSNLDLVAEAIDVAVRIGALADSQLRRRLVGHVRHQIVASPDYLARRPAPRDPADLHDHLIIHTATRPMPPEWRFADAGRDRILRFTPRLVVNHVETALDCARSGLGAARALSYQVADDVAAGRLVPLLEAYETTPIPVQLLHVGSPHPTVRLLAFVERAEPALTSLPALRGSR